MESVSEFGAFIYALLAVVSLLLERSKKVTTPLIVKPDGFSQTYQSLATQFQKNPVNFYDRHKTPYTHPLELLCFVQVLLMRC